MYNYMRRFCRNRLILGSLKFLCSLPKEKLDKNNARLEICLGKPVA